MRFKSALTLASALGFLMKVAEAQTTKPSTSNMSILASEGSSMLLSMKDEREMITVTLSKLTLKDQRIKQTRKNQIVRILLSPAMHSQFVGSDKDALHLSLKMEDTGDGETYGDNYSAAMLFQTDE